MRPIHEIVIHAAATRPEWWADKRSSEKVAEVKLWHTRDRKWSDLGYHAMIDRDGTVVKGRPETKVPASVKGHNTGTLAVCLFGGFGGSADDKFKDNFTPAQDAALRKWIKDKQIQYPTIKKISGHNEYAAKACPTFRVGPWLAQTSATNIGKPAPTRTIWQVIMDILRGFK